MVSCQHTPVRQTITGCVADASMNNIMLVTSTGDTLSISTMDTDPAKVPGVMVYDSVKITFVKEKAGETNILKAEELTITAHSPYFYIAGTWVEPNPINPSEMQGMILNSDGTASSVGMATLLFKKWKLAENQLLLTSESFGNKLILKGVDTLRIVKLDADSLVLTNRFEMWRLSRKK